MNHIGERIKHLRKSKNMTQAELGEILGVKKACIQKYEANADPNLSADKIRLLCATFDTYPRTFIYPNDNELWEKVYEFWETETTRRRNLNYAKFPEKISEDYLGLKALGTKIGQNHLGLLMAMQELNSDGIERVKTYMNDIRKINEYRAKDLLDD